MQATSNLGQTTFEEIFGVETASEIRNDLSKLSSQLAEVGIDFPFDKFYSKKDLLDLKKRELVTISSLVTQGALPQLKLHLKAALNVGCSIVEIEQTILQLIIYVGMPKVINAMKIFKGEVIK